MPMSTPKVSVLMPVYNGEAFLREAIESILNQTFSNFEFLIINDGSTDQTEHIINSYHDPRIVVIENPQNLGLTKSSNIGVQRARGEYVMRMDADDISLPVRIEKMVNYLDKNKEVGLIGSSYVEIDDNGKELMVTELPTDNESIQKELLSRNAFCSEMFRRSCMEDVGGYREEIKYGEDYDLSLRIAEKCKVGNINEVLYKYRINLESICLKTKPALVEYTKFIHELAQERRQSG